MKKVLACMLFSGIIFYSNFALALPKSVKEKVELGKLLVYKSEKTPFLICKYRFNLKLKKYSKNKNLNDYVSKQLKIVLKKKIRDYIKIFPLYPVFLLNETAEKEKFECIFLLPHSYYEQLVKYSKAASISTTAYTANGRYNNLVDDKKVNIDFCSDMPQVLKLQDRWKAAIKQQLSINLSHYEDTEFETFLYMRLFNSVPQQKPNNWKKDDLSKLFFTFSGLNDIRDAVPLDKDDEPLMEAYNQAPPKPLSLPQVSVIKTDVIPGLAKWVPRSCYYIEWKGFKKFKSTLSGFTEQFDKWSPGTYPSSGDQIVAEYLEKAGLGDKKSLRNIESIALAGWDFYFQSGTSILLVMKTKNPFKKLPAAPFVSSPEKNIIVLSTSKKLYKMALEAYAKKRSLSQVNNFAYSRKRLSVSKGESELVWLYLSDYWLTNLLSPRWLILSNRLAKLDARLRFVYLLKICRMLETASNKLPSLKEIKSSPFLSPKLKKWLFAGLVEKSEVIKDEKFGSLYKHPPIDAMPFGKVSKSEASRYRNFKRLYTRRWKQIDPIALQLVRNNKGVYKTRLYISPISNRSDFRSIQNFAPKQKVKHVIKQIDGKAFGLSVAIATPAFKPFLGNIALPVNMFIQLVGFDFAPSSYSPASWLEPARSYDYMSYLRIPAAISLPSLAFNALIGMAGRINTIPSDYDGIDKISESMRDGFSAMILERKLDGIHYLGADPSTLIRIRDNSSGKFKTDSVPCDIRLYLNFIDAYQLRRKLWFEAIKNRGIATWRRNNRIFRIRQFLNSISGSITNNIVVNNIRKMHLFPTQNIIYINGIPQLRNASSIGRRSYSSSILRNLSKLPKIMLEITQIDSFISVEENALFFESHFQLQRKDENRRTTQGAVNRQPAAQPNSTSLDFDE
jgi:hypothetical protein